jgi:hypothetical protein
MHARLGLLAVALGTTLSAAQAQQTAVVTRAEPVRAISRLASQGIGYSVVYEDPAAPGGRYRVKVVCTVGQLSAFAVCPSAAHDAFCPTAQIACR